ncbi:MAG: carboxymuconolactone decarboxylase family protein [Actinomycetota bacterium]
MTNPTVPRITPLADDQWDKIAEALPAGLAKLSRGGREDGPVLKLFSTLGHHPTLLGRWLGFAGTLLNGTLPPREREMAVLRTAWLCQVDYEWGPHAAAARAAGLSDDDLARIIDGPSAEGWDQTDAALLRAVDELHTDARLTDATWETLAARFSEPQMIELLMLIGQYHLAAFTLNSLHLSAEPGAEPLPGPVQ